MTLDVLDLREFYVGPLGRMVRHVLRRHLACLWPSLAGETILGLGYATPLMRPWLGKAGRLLALMRPEQGVVYWPREGPNMAALTSFADLPLADESVDRVLLLHALESSPSPELMLREAWRVLGGQGRVLVVVPNRRGFWAHHDGTPFGTGQPFSASQIKRLLREQGFLVERTVKALFFLPSSSRLALALAEPLENLGRRLFPGLAGVFMVEASKQVYTPVLTKARTWKSRLVLPSPFPASSGPVGVGRVRKL